MKITLLILVVLLTLLSVSALFAQETIQPTSSTEGTELGSSLPLWSSLPFIGILLSIALFPLFAPHFWHHHFRKVSAFWALILVIPFLWFCKGEAFHSVLEVIVKDYIPFIILLWALFTISGGILVEGQFSGKPVQNTLFLLIGAFLASWVGTTGASMLLIRPVLRANAHRKNKAHVIVFFIFLISNIGGALTPLGDPPLFLGFLHGVPFFWTLHLFKPMVFAAFVVLAIFFIMDTVYYSRERNVASTSKPATKDNKAAIKQRFAVRGLFNIIFLVGVIGGILMSGLLRFGEINLFGVHLEGQNLLRDVILIVMGLCSLKLTPKYIREANGFNWAPIEEVAVLFAGIFVTIIPTLAILRAGTNGAFAFLINAVKEPHHYFWMAGGLSSFLDNAPTYLTFFNTALGNFFSGIPERESVHLLIAQKEVYLTAISCGAVFMGANTYIGNAPNFMVKSIAEENNLKMPSFFGYMGYSIAILIPVFILISLIFF
jgi:Na+/H+ antiporter NhaD/arsenite permease-like protein